MKLTNFFLLLALSVFVFSGCKKDDDDDDENNTPTTTVDVNGNLNPPSDADGACYSAVTRIYDYHADSSYDDLNFTYAWFGKVNAFVNGGTVSANAYELSPSGFYNTYTFIGLDDLFPSNAVEWEVSGNTSTGVPAFTHTDNIAFPTGGDFVLPATVNINNPLTINFSPVTNVSGIVYTLKGNKGQKNKAVLNGASSVTFTSAELKEVAFPDDAIGVGIMPVVYQPTTLNGKKIYFVKQFQYLRETATL
jgi:hypothetical protein